MQIKGLQKALYRNARYVYDAITYWTTALAVENFGVACKITSTLLFQDYAHTFKNS